MVLVEKLWFQDKQVKDFLIKKNYKIDVIELSEYIHTIAYKHLLPDPNKYEQDEQYRKSFYIEEVFKNELITALLKL